MSIRGADWSAEDVATLRKLWGGKISASGIAALLGRNKNAVIGKAHRLKLPPRRASPAPRGTIRRQIARAITKAARKASLPKPPTKPTEVRKVETPLPEPVSLRVSMMDLTDSQCRFIAEEPREATFCGHQVKDGSSYCPHHHARVWVKANAKSSVPFRKHVMGIAA